METVEAWRQFLKSDRWEDEILGVDGWDEFAICVAPVGKISPAAYHFGH